MNPGMPFQVIDFSNLPRSTICSWCGAYYFPPVLTTTGTFVDGDMCHPCTEEGIRLGILYYNCPNAINCCSFVGLADEMQDHLKCCDFALVKCVFRCCPWLGVLSLLRQHFSQCHYVLPHDFPEILKPRLVFVILHEQSFFIVHLRVIAEMAQFCILYYGPPNKYSLAVRMGTFTTLFLTKSLLVPAMHSFFDHRITFAPPLVISFDLRLFRNHLGEGGNIFEHVTFSVNVCNVPEGVLHWKN